MSEALIDREECGWSGLCKIRQVRKRREEKRERMCEADFDQRRVERCSQKAVTGWAEMLICGVCFIGREWTCAFFLSD